MGLVGLYLATADTYWLPGTLLSDLKALVVGLVDGALAGFFLGCIVERPTDRRSRRFKILCWLLVMTIVGSFFGLGKGTPVATTLIVFAVTLGMGLVLGFLYVLQSAKESTRSRP